MILGRRKVPDPSGLPRRPRRQTGRPRATPVGCPRRPPRTRAQVCGARGTRRRGTGRAASRPSGTRTPSGRSGERQGDAAGHPPLLRRAHPPRHAPRPATQEAVPDLRVEVREAEPLLHGGGLGLSFFNHCTACSGQSCGRKSPRALKATMYTALSPGVFGSSGALAPRSSSPTAARR